METIQEVFRASIFLSIRRRYFKLLSLGIVLIHLVIAQVVGWTKPDPTTKK
jgi:hypothetical protein